MCSNSSNHCRCADEVGAERGFLAQDSAGKGLSVLTQQLFLLSQQVRPRAGPVCWGGHPHPPGPSSQLRGPRAGGDTPSHPKTGFPLQSQGSAEAL